jgi:hypothetical protein
MKGTPPRLDDLIELVEGEAPEGKPLQHLTDSVLLAGHLNELADHLMGHFVDRARNDGASWAEIGNALGVTKQAAQKRFVTLPSHSGTKTLFARFNDEARTVVLGAQDHSRRAQHDHVGTGHIVLALVNDPDAVAAKAIAVQGVTPEEVREAIEVALGPPQGSLPDHIPFAADAKKVLDLALREALRMQDAHIGPEHILLGLLRDQKSLGATTLAGLGINRDEIETAIK